MSRLATRLTVAVVGITAGTVLVAALVMWLSLRAVLLADIERDLDERSERLQRFAGSGRWRMPRPPDGRGGPPRLTQVIALDGSNLGPEPETDLRPPGLVPPDGWRGTVGRVRVAALAVKPAPPASEGAKDGAIILLGESLAGADAELRRMAIGLSLLWLVATGLAVGAAIALRRAVLRPLASLDAEVSRLRPDDLGARLAIGAAPDEVRSLVGRLNAMLGGLEQAFRREQATIANIAHELRTPVAGLRSEIEFRLLATADPAEQTVLRGLLANVGRMQAMVGNILMLARIEAGRERLTAEPVDLAPLIEAVVERWEAQAAGRGQAIACRIDGGMVLTSSPVHLDVVLDNLVGNAVAHGDAGEISIGLDGPCVTVRNPCRTMPDPERLGTAFYRADEARSDGSHCGLGLALCRRILAGEFGRLQTVRVSVSWQRNDVYYARTDWAGRLVLRDRLVLDGPLGNAMAHFVHDALHWAGPAQDAWAQPLRVRASLLRAHRIEGADTVLAEVETAGPLVRIAVTHAGETARDACEELILERAVIRVRPEGAERIRIVRPGQPDEFITEADPQHVRENLRAAAALVAAGGGRPATTLADSRPFVQLNALAHISTCGIGQEPGCTGTMPGILAACDRFLADGTLPSFAWIQPPAWVTPADLPRLRQAVERLRAPSGRQAAVAPSAAGVNVDTHHP